jgi:hypothetical protein
MMQLPQGYRHGVWGYYGLWASEFCRCKAGHVVIFVDLAGKSWINFPAAAMAEAKRQGVDMIIKKIINPQRVRCIHGGFSFIPHRFLTQGFLASLEQKELLLYLFLILAADRYGLSYYSYERICSLLQITTEQYITARDALIKKDLIAFDGTVFQVLELPPKPLPAPTVSSRRTGNQNPVPIADLIQQNLKGICHE